MRIAVVGYGVEGRAAVEYWRPRGDIVVHDRKDVELPPDVEGRTGADYLRGLDEADLIVRAPGVHPSALPSGPQVTSVIGEFLAECPVPVIGVTGTQGKGTTCTAIAAILGASGRRVFLGGNIGVPPLQFLPELADGDVVVLELSNMQLIDLKRSPRIAVVLPVTPDHLNWHPDIEEYYAAKTSIAAYQGPGDTVFFAAGNPVAERVAAAGAGRKVPFGVPEGVHAADGAIHDGTTRLLDLADSPLLGAHNVANLTAAVAATFDLLGRDTALLREGVRAIKPLPHRLEPAGESGGVAYVNDSLSTTPETARAAMAAFPGPKVMIFGGSSKGLAFEALAEAVAKENIRGIVIIGEVGPRIAAALDEAGITGHTVADGPMTEVVAKAAAMARPGDTVLLSPACASFGDFRDYADRGNQFKAAVQELIGQEPTG
ncbi:UDP-N-acetylmuramoyl-L-alanine--D-glutamate ligase [Actinomadura livida]|uniref:UDP-N-acetylmuramoylalanine--D-glutamate ligase n=1 Tax=Actinomadura livida TaxID=79909 RepID=A0A7W7N1P7_9ACTN|nr:MULTISPECIES: UDP-N-acetylmuramoyl-L-alanine--D-glutamate ligase [Actinomadura]MBB4778177.1 UDP-N-acetylmuramoylalanine--D-glutamate ligase [Actinomadura catellatispora]